MGHPGAGVPLWQAPGATWQAFSLTCSCNPLSRFHCPQEGPLFTEETLCASPQFSPLPGITRQAVTILGQDVVQL